MQLTPLIAVHMTAALAALATGPVALWARGGARPRPRLHRAFGYAWVTFMLVAALSALFIRDYRLPNIAGYTAIHLLVPTTLITLTLSFRPLALGHVSAHRRLCRGCTWAAAWWPAPSPSCPTATWGNWCWCAGSASADPLAKPTRHPTHFVVPPSFQEPSHASAANRNPDPSRPTGTPGAPAGRHAHGVADSCDGLFTAASEFLLHTPLKGLLPQLDPQVFWQVHRGTVVRAAAIESVVRDDAES